VHRAWSRAGAPRAPFVLAVVVIARATLAAEGEPTQALPLHFRVSYAAHDGCPTEADFRRGVETRALRAKATDDPHASVRLAVTLSRDGERTAGVLVVTLPDGTSSERRVNDAACDAAAASLAVVSALALDALLPAPDPPPGEPAGPAAPPAPATAAPSPGTTAAKREERAPSLDRRRAGQRFDLRVRAHGVWESAVAPRLPLGVLAGGEISWRRAGVLAPSVGLGALVTLSGRATRSVGSASFRLVASRLDACPLRLGPSTGAALRPCLELDGGVLRGTPDETVRNPVARTMPWFAAGITLHGALPVGAALALEAAVSGRMLYRHDAFVLRPNLPVYDVPPLSAGASLGLSYRL
jgi:hypothetical protein